MLMRPPSDMSSRRARCPHIMVCIPRHRRRNETLVLTSYSLPYAWVMVRDFNVGDKSNASFYAGIFISAFAFSESLTSLWWGGFSDRIGRKPILLLGCAGTMLSLLIVGFSSNFWVALAGRVAGGLLSTYTVCCARGSIINPSRRWKHWRDPDHGWRDCHQSGA